MPHPDDIAFLRDELPPMFWSRLAAHLRRLRFEADAGGNGSGHIEQHVEVCAGRAMSTTTVLRQTDRNGT